MCWGTTNFLSQKRMDIKTNPAVYEHKSECSYQCQCHPVCQVDCSRPARGCRGSRTCTPWQGQLQYKTPCPPPPPCHYLPERIAIRRVVCVILLGILMLSDLGTHRNQSNAVFLISERGALNRALKHRPYSAYPTLSRGTHRLQLRLYQKHKTQPRNRYMCRGCQGKAYAELLAASRSNSSSSSLYLKGTGNGKE